jgi:phosphoheptose isomerase
MVETLVFRVRDAKELLQVSLEDSASSVTPPSAMLTAATPVSRIKLERFGKPSVVLARCSSMETGQPVDQSKYEPLFSAATSALSSYRDLLGARTLVPEELARLGRARAKPASRTSVSKH